MAPATTAASLAVSPGAICPTTPPPISAHPMSGGGTGPGCGASGGTGRPEPSGEDGKVNPAGSPVPWGTDSGGDPTGSELPAPGGDGWVCDPGAPWDPEPVGPGPGTVAVPPPDEGGGLCGVEPPEVPPPLGPVLPVLPPGDVGRGLGGVGVVVGVGVVDTGNGEPDGTPPEGVGGGAGRLGPGSLTNTTLACLVDPNPLSAALPEVGPERRQMSF